MLDKTTGIIYKLKSDVKGEATFHIPCNSLFEVIVSNYTKKLEFNTLDSEAGEMYQTIGYPADMLEKDKFLRMNEAEKSNVDQSAFVLPDTKFITGSIMPQPRLKRLLCQCSNYPERF